MTAWTFDFGLALTAAASAYALLVLVAAVVARYRSRNHGGPMRERAGDALQAVSILKPLCGDEPRLYKNLRSFCLQEYPAPVQLVIGVRSADDSALAAARRLQHEFPQLQIELVVDGQLCGHNLKVCNLANILRCCRHPWLVIADSDIAVGPDYLQRVCAPLAEADTGVVTCLYQARPMAGFWPRFGALFIDDWFVPSAQLAHFFGSTDFCFGASIALRRTSLAAIGGFEAVRERLADDYWLGKLTREIGLRTVLSSYRVTTDVTETTARALISHELRWLRTICTLNPIGYFFVIITFDLVLAGIGVLLSDEARPALLLLAATFVARIALHHTVGAKRHSRVWHAVAEWPLLPLRDGLSLMLWGWAFFARRVKWAGQTFDVDAHGDFSEATQERPHMARIFKR